MKDLIEALQIFLKYGDHQYPTHCEHGSFIVYYSNKDIIPEDITRLEELSFNWNEDSNGFISYRYGSC